MFWQLVFLTIFFVSTTIEAYSYEELVKLLSYCETQHRMKATISECCKAIDAAMSHTTKISVTLKRTFSRGQATQKELDDIAWDIQAGAPVTRKNVKKTEKVDNYDAECGCRHLHDAHHTCLPDKDGSLLDKQKRKQKKQQQEAEAAKHKKKVQH